MRASKACLVLAALAGAPGCDRDGMTGQGLPTIAFTDVSLAPVPTTPVLTLPFRTAPDAGVADGSGPAIADAGSRPAVADAGSGPAVAAAGSGPAVADAGSGPAIAEPGSRPAIVPEIVKTHLGGMTGPIVGLDVDADLRWPVRGTLLASGSPRFIVHAAKSAVPLGKQWILVEATTGVWLHEAATLVKRARLARPPIAGLAAAADGRSFAFAAGRPGAPVEIVVVSFPELEVKARAPGVPAPRRMRFTPDGERVVVVPAAGAAAFVDVASGAVERRDDAGAAGGPAAVPEGLARRPPGLTGILADAVALPGGSTVAALDSLALAAVDGGGAVTSFLGPFGPASGDLPARLDAFPDGSVIAALDGRLVRWTPPEQEATLSPDYHTARRWTASTFAGDTALFACRPSTVGLASCAVQRVVHGEAAAEADGVVLGTAEFEAAPAWVEFADGERALLGVGPNHRVRMAFAHADAKFEGRLDTPAIAGGKLAGRPDRRAYAYLDRTGRLFEIKAKPPSVKDLSQLAEPDRAREVRWDGRTRRWRVDAEDGSELTLQPLP